MKVDSFETNVVSTNMKLDSKAYTIENNVFMFQLLSSKLYSDKITAVLREIGCNAADAHTLIGASDLPFEVKLPTALDPTFYIKDFGPGLDDEEVQHLYLSYGKSTKRDSDDFTGMLGVGSKSPYAYTNTFSVTAVKNGSMRTYLSHVDEEGKFTSSLVSEQPATADWPHGLMVSFAVRPADWEEFRAKAKRVYRWFRTTPRILGIGAKEMAAEVEARTSALDGITGLLRSNENVPTVVMGNIAYPVNPRELKLVDGSIEAWLLSVGAVLEAPIGTVNVSASRESLEYDARTKAGLTALLGEESRKVRQAYLAYLANTSTTLFEKAFAIHRSLATKILGMPDTLPGHAEALQQVLDATTANIPGDLVPADDPDMTFQLRKLVSTYRSKKLVVEQLVPLKHAFDVPAWTAKMVLTPESAIVINKTTYKAEAIRSVTEARKGILEIRVKGRANMDRVQAHAKALSDAMGGVPVFHIEDLAEVTVQIRASSQRKGERLTFKDRLVAAADEAVDVIEFTGPGEPARYTRVRVADMPEDIGHFVSTYRNGINLGMADAVLEMDSSVLSHHSARNKAGVFALVDWALRHGCDVKPFILVTNDQRRRLNLEKNGFEPWGPVFRESLDTAFAAKGSMYEFNFGRCANRMGFVLAKLAQRHQDRAPQLFDGLQALGLLDDVLAWSRRKSNLDMRSYPSPLNQLLSVKQRGLLEKANKEFTEFLDRVDSQVHHADWLRPDLLLNEERKTRYQATPEAFEAFERSLRQFAAALLTQ